MKEIIDDGGHAVAVHADVSNLAQVEAAVEQVTVNWASRPCWSTTPA